MSALRRFVTTYQRRRQRGYGSRTFDLFVTGELIWQTAAKSSTVVDEGYER